MSAHPSKSLWSISVPPRSNSTARTRTGLPSAGAHQDPRLSVHASRRAERPDGRLRDAHRLDVGVSEQDRAGDLEVLARLSDRARLPRGVDRHRHVAALSLRGELRLLGRVPVEDVHHEGLGVVRELDTWISFFSIPFNRSTSTPPGPTALW